MQLFKLIRYLFLPLTLPFRTLCRLIRDIDDIAQFCVRFLIKKPYIIEGQCKKRGVCCKSIGIQMSAYPILYKGLRPFMKWWYQFVYNFELINEVPEKQAFIFKCKYLKNNLCSIHWRRPFLCRNYPYVSPYFKPKLQPGCGFIVRDKKE